MAFTPCISMMELGVSTEVFALLILSTLITSAFTAVLGQGGGLMLMGVLAQVMPAASLIPIHAVIQTASNASRAILSLRDINWGIITPILIGILLGAVVVTPLISHINWDGMQLVIGVFILWTVWGNGLKLTSKIPFPLASLGIAQGSLGVLLGATGPLGNAILLAKGLNRESLIASNAVIMFASHAIKIVVFMIMGVALSTYTLLLIALSLAAIIGSYIGKHLRPKLSEPLFFKLFRFSLTLLALRMLYLGLTSFF